MMMYHHNDQRWVSQWFCAVFFPAQINSDPYKEGWMMKIKLSNASEVASLMDAAAYKTSTDH